MIVLDLCTPINNKRYNPKVLAIVMVVFLSACSSSFTRSVRVEPQWGVPDTWNGDFLAHSSSSSACESGIVADANVRYGLSRLLTPQDRGGLDVNSKSVEQTLPQDVLDRISKAHSIRRFDFHSANSQSGYWGFGGLVITLRDCVVYAQVDYYEHGLPLAQ